METSAKKTKLRSSFDLPNNVLPQFKTQTQSEKWNAVSPQLINHLGLFLVTSSDLISLALSCKGFYRALLAGETDWGKQFLKKRVEVKRRWDWRDGGYSVEIINTLPNNAVYESKTYCLPITELGVVLTGTMHTDEQSREVLGQIKEFGFLVGSSAFNLKGNKIGEERYLEEEGTKNCKCSWKNGVKDGEETKWDKNQTSRYVCHWTFGQKDGEEIEYDEEGHLKCQSNWREGLREGIQTLYHPGGAKKSVSTYHNGKKEGKEELWYDNGRKQQEINWVSDLKDGQELAMWNVEGQTIQRKTNWDHGVKSGIEEEFHPTGLLAYHCEFVAGKKEGVESGYHNNGETAFTVNWDNDRELSRSCQAYDGRMIFPKTTTRRLVI